MQSWGVSRTPFESIMSWCFLLLLFSTLVLCGPDLRFLVAAFQRLEPAAFARSIAACFSFFPLKTFKAKSTPLQRICFPIALDPLFTRGKTVLAIELKIFPSSAHCGWHIATTWNKTREFFVVLDWYCSVHVFGWKDIKGIIPFFDACHLRCTLTT